MQGSLVKWNSSGYYGFLKPKDSFDIYVHVKSLRQSNIRDVRIGDVFEFVTMPGKDGRPVAYDLSCIAKGPGEYFNLRDQVLAARRMTR